MVLERSGCSRARLALLAVLAVLVSACAGATPSSVPASGATPAPSPATAGTSPGASPSAGGVVSIAFESDIQYFDPALAYDTVSGSAERLLFDQLVMYDEGTGLIPGLAEAMPTVSSDGLTYTFKLRSGVNFHKPDGSVLREMNADDVVASLNRILAPDLKPNPSPVGPAFFSIIAGSAAVLDGSVKTASGIRAVDPLTVEIELSAPDKRLLNILAMGFGSVVPAEAGLDATAFGAAPIGTGPYHLVEYKAGESATFALNEDGYWGTAPLNAGVEMRFGLDANTQLQQAIAGQLDLMGDFIPPGAYTATVGDPALASRIHRRTDVAVFYLSIDTSAPDGPLSDVLVRRAINHAVDKANLVKVQNGRGGPANCILPPNLPGHDPSCNPYPYDVEKAKALMAEAGNTGFSTKLYTDTTDLSRSLAEAIQADLAKIGITVEIVLQEFDVLLGTIVVPHQAPLVLIGWFQDFPDPSDFIDPILSCAAAVEGGANSAWYCNEEVDTLSAAALAEQDDAKRIAMYQDIQKRIMEDAPWVPTTLNETVEVVSERVSGTYLHPVYPYDIRSIAVSE